MSLLTEPFQPEPASHDERQIERQALLEALRRNLHLLGELAIRYDVETRPERPANMPSVHRSQAVVDLIGDEMSRLAKEQVRVLLLDRQHRVTGQRTIYQGNGYGALVRAAEIFRPAIAAAVPSIIVAHGPAPNCSTETILIPCRGGCWF